MSEYVWTLAEPDQPVVTVSVLAWHGTTATVLRLDAAGLPVWHSKAFIVRTTDLRIGYPPKDVELPA